jgi:hypothetical protein
MVVVLTIGCFTFPLDESSTSTRSSLVTRPLPGQKKNDFVKLRPVTDGMNLETSTFSSSPMSSKQVVKKPRKPVSSLASVEATTELIHNLRSAPEPEEPENENETDTDKREVLELTTSYMPSFTSTSSAVSPNFYKSESSTQKYVGRLDETSEEASEPRKTKTDPKSELELTTEMNFPTAIQLDKQQGDLIPKFPTNGVMHLEENAIAVTKMPEILETATIKKLKENSNEEDLKLTPKSKLGRKPESEESLNQGKEPSFTEAPQPDN